MRVVCLLGEQTDTDVEVGDGTWPCEDGVEVGLGALWQVVCHLRQPVQWLFDPRGRWTRDRN